MIGKRLRPPARSCWSGSHTGRSLDTVSLFVTGGNSQAVVWLSPDGDAVPARVISVARHASEADITEPNDADSQDHLGTLSLPGRLLRHGRHGRRDAREREGRIRISLHRRPAHFEDHLGVQAIGAMWH